MIVRSMIPSVLTIAALAASPHTAHHDAHATAVSPSASGPVAWNDSPSTADIEAWPESDRDRQKLLEAALIAAVDPAQLRVFHDRIASEPHAAGSPGDQRVIESLATLFMDFGLEVEVHPFWTYISEPVSGKLEILTPAAVELPISERAIEGDPHSTGGGDSFGWNAYSGSGRAEGEVVYANYGRLEDFERLEELGVSCKDKIVLARYGGNYRGYKAKYAEAAGAAALVIYTDPKDAGWGRGLSYPEGGYYNESTIQRGSVKALPYD
ncbi:MAG: N-acetylated-alpha-linked acidic dipeptidase, partial [Planctomycetota bacterium]